MKFSTLPFKFYKMAIVFMIYIFIINTTFAQSDVNCIPDNGGILFTYTGVQPPPISPCPAGQNLYVGWNLYGTAQISNPLPTIYSFDPQLTLLVPTSGAETVRASYCYACGTSIPSLALMTETEECEITTNCGISAVINNAVCNNNGTPVDGADDTFTFDLFVSGGNIGTWSAEVDGQTIYTGQSVGATIVAGPYLISNGSVEVTVNGSNGCFSTKTATPPASCSTACGPLRCIPFMVEKN